MPPEAQPTDDPEAIAKPGDVDIDDDYWAAHRQVQPASLCVCVRACVRARAVIHLMPGCP